MPRIRVKMTAEFYVREQLRRYVSDPTTQREVVSELIEIVLAGCEAGVVGGLHESAGEDETPSPLISESSAAHHLIEAIGLVRELSARLAVSAGIANDAEIETAARLDSARIEIARTVQDARAMIERLNR